MNEQITQSHIKERFYQTKAFRFFTAIMLALLFVLGNGAASNMTTALAGDEQALGAHNEEIVMPELDEGFVLPELDEDFVPPELDEEIVLPELDEDSAAGHPIAEAIAREGMAYVRVGGEAFASARMRKQDLVGSVSGIAIAVAYNEADDEADRPASLAVVLVVGNALKEWHINSASATLLDEYFSSEWSLPAVDFVPVKKEEMPAKERDEEEEEDEEEENEPAEEDETLDFDEPDSDELPDDGLPQPIKVTFSFWGTLGGGTVVVTAHVDGIPEGVDYTLQWQNDISGEFEDMPGETSESITVNINNKNIQCEWRAVVILAEEL